MISPAWGTRSTRANSTHSTWPITAMRRASAISSSFSASKPPTARGGNDTRGGTLPKPDALEPYRRKRHFDRTPEPRGRGRGRAEGPLVGNQKHDGTAPHYDLRPRAEGGLQR